MITTSEIIIYHIHGTRRNQRWWNIFVLFGYNSLQNFHSFIILFYQTTLFSSSHMIMGLMIFIIHLLHRSTIRRTCCPSSPSMVSTVKLQTQWLVAHDCCMHYESGFIFYRHDFHLIQVYNKHALRYGGSLELAYFILFLLVYTELWFDKTNVSVGTSAGGVGLWKIIISCPVGSLFHSPATLITVQHVNWIDNWSFVKFIGGKMGGLGWLG